MSTLVYEIPEKATISESPSVTDFQKRVRDQISVTNSPKTDFLLAITIAELGDYAELRTPVPFPIITSTSTYPEARIVHMATFQGCTHPDSREIRVKPWPEERPQQNLAGNALWQSFRRSHDRAFYSTNYSTKPSTTLATRSEFELIRDGIERLREELIVKGLPKKTNS